MDGNSTGKPKLTDEAAGQFKSGIELSLSRWPALQMAVENHWGVHESHDILDRIYSLFTQSKEKIYIDAVENVLDDAMLYSLNVVLEDGSIEEIAEKLMIMHEECLEGNFSSIEMLRETRCQSSAVPNVAKVVDSSDDDCDDIIDDSTKVASDDSSDMAVDFTSDDLSDMAVDVTQCQSTTCNRKETIVSNSSIVKPHVEAEDGWTVVDNKRNRGRKKWVPTF